MANVSEMYQDKWLKPADLQGSARKVRVESVEVGDFKNMDGQKERKAVVAFVGKSKRLICNATQGKAMIKLFGDDTDGWIGRDVILNPAKNNSGTDTITVTGVPVEDSTGEKIPF